ncbi:MAG: TlyA family rRNA (cytidine-2'-O)-methyltransferase, partial [Enterococcus sp.]|nr:TlyA family rRNA (cytidine-2'-O)-methyltransferase [Enterococcus sp.]
GFDVAELTFSPITGGEGNIEFLAHLKKVPATGQLNQSIDLATVVAEAHQQLDK